MDYSGRQPWISQCSDGHLRAWPTACDISAATAIGGMKPAEDRLHRQSSFQASQIVIRTNFLLLCVAAVAVLASLVYLAVGYFNMPDISMGPHGWIALGLGIALSLIHI